MGTSEPERSWAGHPGAASCQLGTEGWGCPGISAPARLLMDMRGPSGQVPPNTVASGKLPVGSLMEDDLQLPG